MKNLIQFKSRMDIEYEKIREGLLFHVKQIPYDPNREVVVIFDQHKCFLVFSIKKVDLIKDGQRCDLMNKGVIFCKVMDGIKFFREYVEVENEQAL